MISILANLSAMGGSEDHRTSFLVLLSLHCILEEKTCFDILEHVIINPYPHTSPLELQSRVWWAKLCDWKTPKKGLAAHCWNKAPCKENLHKYMSGTAHRTLTVARTRFRPYSDKGEIHMPCVTIHQTRKKRGKWWNHAVVVHKKRASCRERNSSTKPNTKQMY